MRLTCILFVVFALIDLISPLPYNCNARTSCGCSKRSSVISSRIIGGEPVLTSDTWQWIASLRHHDLHQCGATLISSFYAITAAHCVYGEDESILSLNFGITNLSDTGEIYYVNKTIVHPLYDGDFFLNDIALLELHRPVDQRSSRLSPICLLNPLDFDPNAKNYPPTGEKLVAIGWGTTNASIRVSSPILREVTLQAIALDAPSCVNTIYNNTVQFCAGAPEGGKDTCSGDSGGPLMMFKDGRWQLVGITSFGVDCGLKENAGIYTRLTYFDSYIRNILNLHDLREVQEDQQFRQSYSDHLFPQSFVYFSLVYTCIFTLIFR